MRGTSPGGGGLEEFGAIVEVSEFVAGDVEGIGGEVDAVVEAGLGSGGEEFSDDGVEGFNPDVAGVVVGGASPEAVDGGTVVEGVGHGCLPCIFCVHMC